MIDTNHLTETNQKGSTPSLNQIKKERSKDRKIIKESDILYFCIYFGIVVVEFRAKRYYFKITDDGRDEEGTELEVLKESTNILSKSKDIPLLIEIHNVSEGRNTISRL